MSTLAEIEAAADALSPEQKLELLLFLATRLRAEGASAAVTIKSITLEPESIRLGDTATVTVVLTGPAPAPGLDVRMSFTSPVIFGVQVALPTLPIASGSSDRQISVPVSIIVAGLAPNGFSPPGDVTISATAGAVTKTATLRIAP